MNILLRIAPLVLLAISAAVGAADTTTSPASPNFFAQIPAAMERALANGAVIKTASTGLLASLLALEYLNWGVSRVIGSGDDLASTAKGWMRITIIGTLFFALVSRGDVFLKSLLGGFKWVAMNLTGLTSFDAQSLMFQGVELATKIIGSIGAIDALSHPLISLAILFAAICMSIAFVIAGLQLLLAQIEALIVIVSAPLVFAFGGIKFTRDMAMKPIQHAISTGFKFICIAILAFIMQEFGKYAATYMQNISTLETNVSLIFQLIASGVFFLILSFFVPTIASSMLSGAAGMTAGHAITSGMAVTAGAAAATAAAANAAPAAGGAMAKAGTSGLQQLGGVIQAAQAGMEAAGDAGKTGLSAVSHAAGEVAGGGAALLGGTARDVAARAGQAASPMGAASATSGAAPVSSAPAQAATRASSAQDLQGYMPQATGAESSIGAEQERKNIISRALGAVGNAASSVQDLSTNIRDAAAPMDDRTTVSATFDHRGGTHD